MSEPIHVKLACLLLSDENVIKIAKFIKFKSNGVAEKMLNHYLDGKGGIVEIDLKKLWKEEKNIQKKIINKLFRNIVDKNGFKGEVLIEKSDFQTMDWYYAIGGFLLKYEANFQGGDNISLKIFFENEYDWDPEKDDEIKCIRNAAENLKKNGAKDFKMKGNAFINIKLPKTTPSTYKGRSFTGNAIICDPLFLPALKRIDDYAWKRKIKIIITHSFRKAEQFVNGAIVNPASRSNHLIGHAIDFNIEFNNKKFTSKQLNKLELKKQPMEIQKFIEDIERDPELRWGGNFIKPDPIHIDIPVNVVNKKLWEDRFKIFQEGVKDH